MALRLAGNWSDEIRRGRLSKRLSPEQIDFLWPDYPAGVPSTLPDLAALLEGLPLDRLARETSEINGPWRVVRTVRRSDSAPATWIVSSRVSNARGPSGVW